MGYAEYNVEVRGSFVFAFDESAVYRTRPLRRIENIARYANGVAYSVIDNITAVDTRFCRASS